MDTKEELKKIQKQLKEPFAAYLHQVREIPGLDKKWVFVSWQSIRERLDDVCVDWQPRITSDVQILQARIL